MPLVDVRRVFVSNPRSPLDEWKSLYIQINSDKNHKEDMELPICSDMEMKDCGAVATAVAAVAAMPEDDNDGETVIACAALQRVFTPGVPLYHRSKALSALTQQFSTTSHTIALSKAVRLGGKLYCSEKCAKDVTTMEQQIKEARKETEEYETLRKAIPTGWTAVVHFAGERALPPGWTPFTPLPPRKVKKKGQPAAKPWQCRRCPYTADFPCTGFHFLRPPGGRPVPIVRLHRGRGAYAAERGSVRISYSEQWKYNMWWDCKIMSVCVKCMESLIESAPNRQTTLVRWTTAPVKYVPDLWTRYLPDEHDDGYHYYKESFLSRTSYGLCGVSGGKRCTKPILKHEPVVFSRFHYDSKTGEPTKRLLYCASCMEEYDWHDRKRLARKLHAIVESSAQALKHHLPLHEDKAACDDCVNHQTICLLNPDVLTIIQAYISAPYSNSVWLL